MMAEDLRRKIESGELPTEPKGPLPTQAELQREFDAPGNALRDTINRLVTVDLVETRPGQGTFVVEKPVPFVTTLTDGYPVRSSGSVYISEVMASGRRPTDSDPTVEIQHATGTVARALRLDDDA